LLTAAAGFGAGGLLTSVAGASLFVESERPAIHLLGSGASISVLIRSGGSRIVVLAGTDAADFGNALSRASLPLLNRIDVVLVANPDAAPRFVQRCLDQCGNPPALVLGPSRRLLDAGIPVNREVTLPLRVDLPGSVELTLPLTSLRDLESGATWSGLLSVGTFSVLMSHGTGEAILENAPSASSAWIRLDAMASVEELREIRPGALAVPASSLSGSQLRAELSKLDYPASGVRVHAGDAVRLQVEDLLTAATRDAQSPIAAANP
jgi:hypothetical protein